MFLPSNASKHRTPQESIHQYDTVPTPPEGRAAPWAGLDDRDDRIAAIAFAGTTFGALTDSPQRGMPGHILCEAVNSRLAHRFKLPDTQPTGPQTSDKLSPRAPWPPPRPEGSRP